MNLTGASSNKRLLSSQRSVAKRVRPSGARRFLPFLPLQQKFARRNNVDTTTTCHATPLWHARAFSSENSWDRLTELGKLPSSFTPMRRIRSVCCARAASGQAAAAPPSAASNSRRPMVTVIRPSRGEVRKRNDTMPRACCPLTAGLASRGRPPKNGAIDHPQPGADKVDSAEGMATLSR